MMDNLPFIVFLICFVLMFLLRMPIIPGVNDTPFHFETAAELVKNSKSLVRIDVLPYQRAAGAKYEMVGREYAPDFDESVPPRFHTEIFDRMGIPYRVFCANLRKNETDGLHAGRRF